MPLRRFGSFWLSQILLGATLFHGMVRAEDPAISFPPVMVTILDDLSNPLGKRGSAGSLPQVSFSPGHSPSGMSSVLSGNHLGHTFLPEELTRLWQSSEEIEPQPDSPPPAEEPILPELDPTHPSSVLPPWLHKSWRHLCTRTHTCYEVICQDLQHMYCGKNLAWLGVGLAVAAPLANTSADMRMSNWYRREVRSHGTDLAGRLFKPLGEHEYLIPVFSVTLLATCWAEEGTACGWVGEWSRRTARAWIIGAPAVGVLQYGLGASRPSEGSTRWRPFEDNNSVAGHGFVAAVPFLAAASMCENPCGKAALVAASTLTSFSRFNNDSHSASQIFLGWWIAYLAVESVCQTEQERRFQFVPACRNADVGLSLVVQY